MQQILQKQDRQALLKAKHCPRMAAALFTHKNTQKPSRPWPLTYDLETQLDSRGCRSKWHATFHQAECNDSWVNVSTSFFALSRNGEKSDNPVLWPWPLTLKFSGFRAVVKEHVGAKFHQAECSGSWVIVHTEKKAMKTIQSVATERTERTASDQGYAESTAFLHRKNAGQLYFSNISSVSFSRLARMFH